MVDQAFDNAVQRVFRNTHDETNRPLTICDLDPILLIQLFAQLLYAALCSEAAKGVFTGLLDGGDIDSELADMALSVAWVASMRLCWVLSNKNRDFISVTYNGEPPSRADYSIFPFSVAALINTIGPIVQSGFPANRTYIPVLSTEDLYAMKPPQYNENYVGLFFANVRAVCRNCIAVELKGWKPNAWWAIRPIKGAILFANSTTRKYSHHPVTSMSLYSPVGVREIPSYCKLALCFANGPLAEPGLAHFSASPWYGADQMQPWGPHTAMPRITDFPPEARSHPYYDQSHKAVYAEVAKRTQHPDPVAAPDAAQPERGLKRRYADEMGDYVDVTIRPRPTQQWRVVYYYYHHKMCTDLAPGVFVGLMNLLNNPR